MSRPLLSAPIATRVAAILATLLAALPAASQAIPARPEQLTFRPITFTPPAARDHRVRLRNGVTAYLVQDAAGQPLVHLQVLVRGGTYLDPPGREGTFALLGGLLRNGGTLDTPAPALDEKLDFLAADTRAAFTETQGALGLDLLERDAREGLGLLAECLARPAFQQDRLDLAKRSLRQVLERRNDDTSSIERYQLGYLLRGEDYYTSRGVTAASLDAITREDLLALHGRLLHPANLVVAVGGRFDRKAMIQALEDTFGALKAAPSARKSPPIPAPTAAPVPGIYLCEKDVNQARITLSLPGLRRSDPDWHAVEVMNFLLGGDFTSRLVMRIRTEEGLAYSVGSLFTPGMAFPGDFRAFFQTKVRTAAYGLKLTLAELARMASSPVGQSELDMAKGALVDRFPNRFPSAAQVASLLAAEDLAGAPEDFHATYRARIQAVTAAEVQRVAAKYLVPARAVVLVVGGRPADLLEGDVKDHPGRLEDILPLPVKRLPLRDPLTLAPLPPPPEAPPAAPATASR